MPKINELPAASSATAADLFAIENSSGTATKRVSGQQIKDFVTADVNAKVTDLKNAIIDYNSISLSDKLLNCASSSGHGVTFTWSNGVCTVTGLSDGATANNIFLFQDIPNYVVRGADYQVVYETTDTNVKLSIVIQYNDNSVTYHNFEGNGTISFPSNAKNWSMRLYVASANISFSTPAVITKYNVLNEYSNAMLREKIEKISESETSSITALTNKVIKADRVINSSALLVAPYNDCDTVPYNTIVCYVSYYPSHSPKTSYTQNSFLLMTYSYIPWKTGDTLVGGAVQIAASADYIGIRYKYTNSYWGSWMQVNNTNIPALSMFDTVGVIGDSWSCGTVCRTAVSDYYTSTKLQWGNIAAKKYGFTVSNFAKPGLSTASWLTDAKGLAAMNAASAKDLYICGLGINDDAQNVTIGDTSDMDDSTKTTFYGSYSKIVNAIKTKAPNAKIALSLIPKYSGSADVTDYNNAIKNVATHFEIALLDVNKNDFLNLSALYLANRQYNHLTAVGYCALADAMCEMLAQSFIDDNAYWKYAHQS